MSIIASTVRARLKRLCPYVGSNIPDSVRENARHLCPPSYDPDKYLKYLGWQWDDGSGLYQCELELCDMDSDTIDPAGYVAIRPLEHGEYALKFVWDLKLNLLIFQTMEEAKSYLDTLLAAPTPQIPPRTMIPMTTQRRRK
jgi:hypothetical protein